VLAGVALAACGGGGSSGSSGQSGSSAPTTYSVGGTVTGLSASGLVLQDNGTDNLTVSSGASTFTFATPQPSGTAYAVTVLTQPTGETCAVSGGTGTITGNVTSVGLTCTVNTYSIGGTVAGLSASGLVLQDNGGDNLAVASGSHSFTFTSKLNSGATYAVTVLTQPTGETCAVSGGTGTATADVTSVSISCSPATYTIGGDISGLNSSGLVLQDNGTDNLSVTSGSAKFTFSTPLDYGATYAVTVSNPPTGETCSVSSGTGTVSGTVTTVRVACATAAYSITGGTTGLTSAGLKLKFYAAGQALSVAPSASGAASYVYPNVPYGTTIAMTFAAQPGWETCAADAGDFSGMLTGNVSAENLTCTADTPTSSVVTPTGHTLSGPDGIAVDAAGNVYVADTTANEILEISPAGAVTVLGASASPAFNAPDGLAVDAQGNVFVADTGNNLIREISASTGAVTTLATAATFASPEGVAVDSAGNVYVANTFGSDIREIVAAGGTVSSSSAVVTLAGGVTTGCLDGNGAAAEFDAPTGIALGPSGNLYVADSNNNVIRKITSVGPSGTNTVTTWAGGQGTCDSLSPASSGYEDGAATTQALFADPTGVAVDSAGNVFVADQGNSAVREVSPAGTVTTIAGATQPSGGTTTVYGFNLPFGITVDTADNLYVSNTNDNQIVKLKP
jgi:hypothetical protein